MIGCIQGLGDWVWLSQFIPFSKSGRLDLEFADFGRSRSKCDMRSGKQCLLRRLLSVVEFEAPEFRATPESESWQAAIFIFRLWLDFFLNRSLKCPATRQNINVQRRIQCTLEHGLTVVETALKVDLFCGHSCHRLPWWPVQLCSWSVYVGKTSHIIPYQSSL